MARHFGASAEYCDQPLMDSKYTFRILVVDDNRDAADMLGELLTTMGHDVRVAYDGAQGLAQFDAFAPDLAILDLGLPEIDGFTLASLVRERERFSAIPLIAHSAYNQPEDVKKAHAAGFTYHLAKPADLSHLIAIIDEHRARK